MPDMRHNNHRVGATIYRAPCRNENKCNTVGARHALPLHNMHIIK
jgi:hypothetical protein